jgi:ligand-binding sensor domain-containing protein
MKLFALFLMFAFCTYCKGQGNTNLPKDSIKFETKEVSSYEGYKGGISRNIIQDRKGNIWVATYSGVFRYDGKFFTKLASKGSSSRFFSVFEDSRGNIWFGSIGSGVYLYDGNFFQNFTTNDGLVNNEIVCIYEDKVGNIWFGANGGTSRFNGKSFQNFKIKNDTLVEDRTGIPFPNLQRPPNEVNAIIEDKTGKFWFGTRGNTYIYDGKTFTVLIQNGQTFTNVRTIIKDKKGNIWLGGPDGLWRYDGTMFTNFTKNFVGYIYEDRKGNIWTSSEIANSSQGWVISRYDAKTLSNKKPIVTEIRPDYKNVRTGIFGILEANDSSIWFGSLDGVYRYDGNNITDFK